MEDFYDLLEVPEDASTEEIDRAWRRKVRTYHPDINDDARANAQFKTLKKAHEVLADETERAAYDRLGHESYVNQRLDGLPTRGWPRTDATTGADAGSERSDATEAGADATANESATASGRDASEAGASAGTGTRSENRRTAGRRTSAGRTRTQTAGEGRRTSEGARRTAGGTERNSEETRRSGRGSSGSARTGASQTDRGTRASTGTSGRGTAGNGAASGSNAGTAGTTSSTTRSGIRSTPLLYGWLGVLLAGLVYVAGLWQYLRTNAGAVSTVRRTAITDPVTALTATHELLAPGRFVLESVTVDAPLTLLFPVGTVALAVALVAVVQSFGRGVAYLYALGGLVPLFALAAGPVVTLPDGVVLLLLLVCPLLATAGFLVDVGRVVL